MKIELVSVQAEVDLEDSLTLSKEIITQLLLELEKDYESSYKIKDDFIYLVDIKRGSQLSISPSNISLIERNNNFEEIYLKKYLDKILNICMDEEVSAKLPMSVTVGYNLKFKDSSSAEHHFTNINSIINTKNIMKPFALTGINFVTEESNTIYHVRISLITEGYEIEVKCFIDYSIIEDGIENSKNLLTDKICNILNTSNIG